MLPPKDLPKVTKIVSRRRMDAKAQSKLCRQPFLWRWMDEYFVVFWRLKGLGVAIEKATG